MSSLINYLIALVKLCLQFWVCIYIYTLNQFPFPLVTLYCIFFENTAGCKFHHPPPTQIYAIAHYLLNKKWICPKHAGCCFKPQSTASGCKIMGICVSLREVPWRTPIYTKKPSVTAQYIVKASSRAFSLHTSLIFAQLLNLNCSLNESAVQCTPTTQLFL